jgi:hypothetical protein
MNIGNLQIKFIQKGYAKYIECKHVYGALDANLNALNEFKPRLMRMGAKHMNKPWLFTDHQRADLVTNEINGLNEYFKAYNELGICTEYIMAYEYLMFLIYYYDKPPMNLETLKLRPIDLIDTIDRILLGINDNEIPTMELAKSLVVSYQVNVDMWMNIWHYHGFQYPRIHE